MFHVAFKPERIDFKSNPPLSEKPVIVPDMDPQTGTVRNAVKMVPGDNKSPLALVHYDRESMSLRALLNLGVPLQKVSLGSTENDPNVLNNLALHMDRQIQSRIDMLSSQSSSDTQDSKDSSPSNS